MHKKLITIGMTMVFVVAASTAMLGAGSSETDALILPSGQGIFQVGGLNNPGALPGDFGSLPAFPNTRCLCFGGIGGYACWAWPGYSCHFDTCQSIPGCP